MKQIVFSRVTEKLEENGKVVSSSKTTDEEIGFVETDGVPAEVAQGIGVTKNLGNFQSKRVDVYLKLPCNPQDFEAAAEFVNKWTWDRLKKSMNPPVVKEETPADEGVSY